MSQFATTITGQRGSLATLAGVCQSWGEALADLHNVETPRHVQPLAPRPWVLNPRQLPATIRWRARHGPRLAVLDALDSDAVLQGAVQEVRERWSERYWMHGDIRPSRVLVHTAPSLQVSFATPTMAGLGDPAWDLSAAIDTITWLAPRWESSPQPLVHELMVGYRRSHGPGLLYPAMQAVHAVSTAWEVAGASGEEREVTGWLDRARRYARRATVLAPAVA